MKEEARGLTKGPIFKELTSLALPIMASSFLVTAYNITDMFWIGRLGAKAVAGVGVAGMYVWFSNGLAALTRIGGQVSAAQELGRDNLKEAKKYAAVALQLIILFGAIFGLISITCSDGLIGIYNLDDAVTYNHAKVYLQITCGLVIFSYLINTLTGIYTAWGDSKTPLKVNFIGLVFNMILDPLLIEGYGVLPRLEVAGAAIATVVAQMVAVILLIVLTIRNNNKDNLLKNIQLIKKYDNKYIKRIVKIGGPIAIQSTLYCFISMMLTRLVTLYGAAALAVQRVGGQIESISWNTADGFGTAVNTFSAQNYGAGKMDRVKKGYKIAALTVLVWGILIAIAFITMPMGISKLFFFEKDAIKLSMDYLIIIGLSEPFMCVELLAIGAISGLGNTKICSLISVVFTGIRIPIALLLTHLGAGLNGVWWALTISSVIKGILLHIAFYIQCKKSIK